MKFIEFKKRVRNYPVIGKNLPGMLGEDERITRNQLSRWQKQGLVIRLKKGLYLLNREERLINPSLFFLANQMVFPSYVSLESALAYYHLIPETVFQVTSVTTGKPARYSNPEGTFTFRHIKSLLFFGFESIRDRDGLPVFIANPEKALLDFFYLNLSVFSTSDNNIFTGSYRFSNHEILNPKKLKDFAVHFRSKKLLKVTELYIKEILSGEVHA